ncbi:hypothetical protein HYX70_00845 [Candidatus Saccharibacteria bacterium]|nr:hypothetical protein [Candidatus Saccharibacteria bacterium]
MNNRIQPEQLNALIEQSLKALKKDRDREILRRRFGITGGRIQTLEEIGQDLGITRERVRQIEKAALMRIREQGQHDHELTARLQQIMANYGGIISFDVLLNQLQAASGSAPRVSFLIRLNPGFYFVDKTDHHIHLVLDASIYSERDLAKLYSQLVDVVTDLGKPVKFDKVMARIDGPHKSEAMQQLALTAHNISNLDDLWGLSQWPEVNPRSIRDKIYLVLKKASRPMHFTEIAHSIGKLKANPKSVTTQAVHNELIKDSRFVLIGRGIYALSEWGYKAGTVADIIEEVLKAESPLPKDQIIERVLARRQVKPSTIVLNLQEKPQFERVGKGIYGLKKSA